MKIIFSVLIATLMTSPVWCSGQIEWNIGELKTELVTRNMLSELDNVDALHTAGLSYTEIAKQMGLIEVDEHKSRGKQEMPEEMQSAIANDGDYALALRLRGQETGANHFDSDHAFALHLQEQEKGAHHFGSDHALAVFLDQEERRLLAPKYLSPDIVPMIEFRDGLYKQLQVAMIASAKFNTADVHAFNKVVVAPCRATVYNPIIEALGLNPDIKVPTILEKLIQHADGSFNAGVQKMHTHNLSAVDGETGLRVDQALSYAFSLCQKIDALPHLVDAFPYHFLVHSIKENVDTNGGCHPGYAGRLFRDFMQLANIYLTNVIRMEPK